MCYVQYILGFSGVNCEGTRSSKEQCQPTNSCDGHYTCHGETGQKICLEGYKGADCKEREFTGTSDGECPKRDQAPLECKHGNCWNKTCCCEDGYKGQLCENEIIECLSNPCVNGICKDEVGEYWCECPEVKQKL